MAEENNIYSTDFWSSAINYAWHKDFFAIVLIIALIGIILFRIRPDERRIVRDSFVIFILTLAGLLISGLLQASGHTESANWVQKIFVFIQGIIVIRLTALLLFRTFLPSVKISLPSILEDILVFIAFFIWGAMQLRYAGLDLGDLVTTSAIMTAIIAFAMQDTLGNLLGGVALQWDHSLKCGDWIRVNDIEGKVVDIRWRAVFVETRDWETVVVPNSILMKNTFKVLGERVEQPVQWRR